MTEEKKNKRKLSSYKEMSRKDLESIARDIHEMDHDERLQHTQGAIEGYQISGVIDAEYNRLSAGIEFGEGASEMQKLYKGLHDDHANKKGDLEQTATTEWMRKVADKIMPAMQLGVAGNTEFNYQNLVRYCQEADHLNQRKEGETLNEVRSAIAKGRGSAAVATIIESISTVTRVKELNNFVELLLPGDHYDFIKSASERIAKDVNSHLKETPYQVSSALISRNFVPAFMAYSRHDYASLAMQYREKKQMKKEGNRHAA